jgi:hypothetical protein
MNDHLSSNNNTDERSGNPHDIDRYDCSLPESLRERFGHACRSVIGGQVLAASLLGSATLLGGCSGGVPEPLSASQAADSIGGHDPSKSDNDKPDGDSGRKNDDMDKKPAICMLSVTGGAVGTGLITYFGIDALDKKGDAKGKVLPAIGMGAVGGVLGMFLGCDLPKPDCVNHYCHDWSGYSYEPPFPSH